MAPSNAALGVDDRKPVATFQVQEYTLGFLPPDPEYFPLIIALISLQLVLLSCIGVIVYYGILKNTNQQSRFVLAFGILLPILCFLPFRLVDLFGIQNVAIRMGLGPPPLTGSLLILEALSGFTPQAAQSSLWDYVCHFGLFMRPKRKEDGTLVRATFTSIITDLGAHILFISISGILWSWLRPLKYAPCPTTHPSATGIFLATDPGQLFNNWIGAVLLGLTLHLSFTGISVLIQLGSGVQMESVMDSPMFQSTSPSEFWGKRWNRLIHSGLKQGVYKPVRNWTNSRSLAAMSAFLTSGILHEYVWILLFHGNLAFLASEPHAGAFGKSLLFFGWNGLLVVLEYMGGIPSLRLPTPLVTFLVLMMALPVAHFLTGDLVEGGYMDGISSALPMVIVLEHPE